MLLLFLLVEVNRVRPGVRPIRIQKNKLLGDGNLTDKAVTGIEIRFDHNQQVGAPALLGECRLRFARPVIHARSVLKRIGLKIVNPTTQKDSKPRWRIRHGND